MAKYFSPKRGGFFDEAIHGPKGAKGSKIPKDAVLIEDEAHTAVLAEQAEGKRIVAGDGGAPVAVVPVLTDEEILAAARARRDRELASTDWTQGAAPLPEETRKEFAEHRQALRDYPNQVAAAIAAGANPAAVPYPEPPAIVAPVREGGLDVRSFDEPIQ